MFLPGNYARIFTQNFGKNVPVKRFMKDQRQLVNTERCDRDSASSGKLCLINTTARDNCHVVKRQQEQVVFLDLLKGTGTGTGTGMDTKTGTNNSITNC